MQPPSPFESLQEALRGFPQSRGAILVLAGGRLALGGVVIALRQSLWGDAEPGDLTRLDHLLGFVVQAAYAAGWAFIACAAFWRAAHEIDRPLWKIDSTGQSLRRFYTFWFLAALAIVVVHQAILPVLISPNAGSGAGLLLLGAFFLEACIVPMGACVMFVGHFSWDTRSDALEPLYRAPATAFFYVLLSFMFLVMLHAIVAAAGEGEALRIGVLLVLEGMGAVADLIVFAGVFELCRFHRNHPSEEEDWDL